MKLTDVAHRLAGHHLQPGSIAIDATVGNGHDTLFLANQVGDSGQVYGLDIQPEAIATTTARLSKAGLAGRATLHQVGHEHLSEAFPQTHHHRVDVVIFNLGYLPGGDHAITTTAATTLPALAQACELLAPGGLLLVTLYPGHPEGDREAADVTAWARSLEPSTATASEYRLLNRSPQAPRLLLVHSNR